MAEQEKAGERLELEFAVVRDHPQPELLELVLHEPATLRLGRFDLAVTPNTLTARSSASGSLEDARIELEGLLEAWAAEIYLRTGFPLRFRFERSDLIDAAGEALRSQVTASLHMQAAIKQRQEGLPEPTQGFDLSEPVEAILAMWREYREGRSRLATAAYWTATVLEAEFHPKDAQWARCGIDQAVYRTLVELSSNRPHPQHARKFLRRKPQMTEVEATWLMAAIPAIALQLALLNTGETVSPLTLGDLPPLPDPDAGGTQ